MKSQVLCTWAKTNLSFYDTAEYVFCNATTRFESAVTTQNDEFKDSFDNSSSRSYLASIFKGVKGLKCQLYFLIVAFLRPDRFPVDVTQDDGRGPPTILAKMCGTLCTANTLAPLPQTSMNIFSTAEWVVQ